MKKSHTNSCTVKYTKSRESFIKLFVWICCCLRAPTDRIPVEAPDVHIIVIDSVSMSQFFRSMPITTHYLRTEMDAVVFPYLNKVGLNSRPNAYGFLMGNTLIFCDNIMKL